jgi:hypothetical protein
MEYYVTAEADELIQNVALKGVFSYLDNNNCEKRDWCRGPTTSRHQQVSWIHSQNIRAPA